MVKQLLMGIDESAETRTTKQIKIKKISTGQETTVRNASRRIVRKEI